MWLSRNRARKSLERNIASKSKLIRGRYTFLRRTFSTNSWSVSSLLLVSKSIITRSKQSFNVRIPSQFSRVTTYSSAFCDVKIWPLLTTTYPSLSFGGTAWLSTGENRLLFVSFPVVRATLSLSQSRFWWNRNRSKIVSCQNISKLSVVKHRGGTHPRYALSSNMILHYLGWIGALPSNSHCQNELRYAH